ncbi:MAG: DUF3991 domain-containing protein [Acetobacteraceae bacterium]
MATRLPRWRRSPRSNDSCRRPEHYPLFAKPIDGKYSLSVINADGLEPDAGRVRLRGQESRPVSELANEIAAHGAGYLIQRLLAPDEEPVPLFGPAQWSVRALVLLTQSGPVFHPAVAKIATRSNPADNFWRAGNTLIPDWNEVRVFAKAGALLLPGIRTQSWDVALTDRRPVLLEVDFCGNLNLAQLAHGAGVPDDTYTRHLRHCGCHIGTRCQLYRATFSIRRSQGPARQERDDGRRGRAGRYRWHSTRRKGSRCAAAARRSAPRRTPLPRAGFAVAGRGRPRRWERGDADRIRPAPQSGAPIMAGQDAELDLFRAGVNCASLLERLPPPWRLDVRESTHRALKYRRGEGEIVIVNHDGRGWWDPQSTAKGDVFDLVQHLDRSLNFGQVRQVLRPLVGLPPRGLDATRVHRQPEPSYSLQERWDAHPRLRRGSPAWRYLAETRCLPSSVLIAADAADVVREGYYGSAWFAHRDCGEPLDDGVGVVRHIEVRGPDFKGSLRGGAKTLFQLPGEENGPKPRLAITEAPIDALSLAAIEELRGDTLYLATGGGMGPGTVQAIERLLAARTPCGGVVVSATDANPAGERYAARHAEMAAAACIPFGRLSPTIGTDWNDVIAHRRGT